MSELITASEGEAGRKAGLLKCLLREGDESLRTSIIVQARMTSTRFPGKVLKEVLGKPLLEYQIERLCRVKMADDVIIATTLNQTDQPIVDLCEKLGVKYFRGSEEDVLSRYYYAAQEAGADVVVRVTSDCPLIDPTVIDKVIDYYKHNTYDYVSNVMQRTYPRGMDTEVFSMSALERAFREAKELPEREHVTLYLERHPELFGPGDIAYKEDQSRHRWTVDQEEDFQLIKLILENIYIQNPLFTLEDILMMLERHPEWVQINAEVEQKEV